MTAVVCLWAVSYGVAIPRSACWHRPPVTDPDGKPGSSPPTYSTVPLSASLSVSDRWAADAPTTPTYAVVRWPATTVRGYLQWGRNQHVTRHQARYNHRISFSGKSNAYGLSRRVRPRITRDIKKYGAGDERCRANNVLIEGDNLQAMATLYKLLTRVRGTSSPLRQLPSPSRFN